MYQLRIGWNLANNSRQTFKWNQNNIASLQRHHVTKFSFCGGLHRLDSQPGAKNPVE
jgi:hypothetical protein